MLNQIPVNNLLNFMKKKRTEINRAIKGVLDSNNYILGNEVKKFEKNFSKYLNIKYCIAVGNGTDALEIALRACGIKAGHMVATVANAGMYTSSALLAIGAKPFFLDVELCSQCVSKHEVERALIAGVDAVVVTHLYGRAVSDIATISYLCKSYNIPLIEDCAQAHGAKISKKYAGTFGDISTFSFYPTKNLGGIGDSGAIITNDNIMGEKVKKLRQYGWNKKYNVTEIAGRNSRMDEIQAAVLSIFLPDLDINNFKRREIANKYSSNIKNEKIKTPKISGEEYVAHLFVIRTKRRQDLIRYLKENGVSSDVHYPIPDHFQIALKEKFGHLSLVNTERLSKEVLSLPCYPNMMKKDINKIINLVNAW